MPGLAPPPVLDHGAFDRDGFAILESVLTDAETDHLTQALAAYTEAPGTLKREDEVYGGRNLLRRCPPARKLARSARLRSIAEAAIGPGAFPVRGLFFDKTGTANWSVPWHQDLTIAVTQRLDIPGFEAWTRKAGIDHVRPPTDVLAGMVTLRVHLDDCPETNGPLRVIPGSHREGRLGAEATRNWLERQEIRSCLVGRGGVVAMRPLILHASSPSDLPGHRRVIHIEYAAEPLPGGLSWYDGPQNDSESESGS